MRLADLHENVRISQRLIRTVDDWASLVPSDRQSGRKEYIEQYLLAYRSILQSTLSTEIGPLFRGIGLSPAEMSILVDDFKSIQANWGLLSSWTTDKYTASSFMEGYYNGVLLKYRFYDSDILFYAPDFWKAIPHDRGGPPASVYEEEAVVYQPSGSFTIDPDMVIDAIRDGK